MGRNILGVAAGVLAAFATVYLVELIGRQFFPLSADIDIRDPEQLRALIATLSTGAKVFVVAGWFGGALVGGIVAAAIVRRPWAAWTPAGVVAATALLNVSMIPHPFWMQVSAVVLPLIGGLIARRLMPMHYAYETEAEQDASGLRDGR